MGYTVDWPKMLPEILLDIAKSLPFYEDFLCFSDVCCSWQSAAMDTTDDYFNRLPSRYPSLMLAEEKTKERSFFLLSSKNNESDHRILNVQLPVASKVQCLSSRGWLLTIAKDSTTKLVHPFSGRKVDLPKLETLRDYKLYVWYGFAKKLVLSSDFSIPSPDDFVVIACWARLGFWRPGDDKWSCVRAGVKGMIFDITYHNGLLYTFHCGYNPYTDKHKYQIRSYNVHGKNQSVRWVSTMPQHYSDCHPWLKVAYVVGLDEKLLIVVRRGKYDEWNQEEVPFPGADYGTNSFFVYEYKLKTKEWSRVNDLGNKALFLGSNSSFSTEASKDGFIKPNCIYYTDNASRETVYKGEGRDMGIYHLSDGRIEPHFTGESLSPHSPPMWVEASSYKP